MKKVLSVFLVIVMIVCLVSCSGSVGPQGQQGIQGEKGDKGDKGEPGPQGEKGKSAYEIYCEQYGYTGSEEEWLDKLHNVLEEYDTECQHQFTNGECSLCGEFDEIYCWDIYQKLRNEMITMENRAHSFTAVEEYLSALPNGYKDIETIKEEFIFLKAQHDVFTNAVFCNLMRLVMNEASQEEIEEYYVDHNKFRRAYFNLINNAYKYPSWDVVNIADNYVFSGDDAGVLLSIIIGTWEDSKGNFINITEKENNNLTFGTNLPNSKDSSKSYFYFVDGRVIGYSLQSNNEEKISAYRIDKIEEDCIEVFCFEDLCTYKLKR